MSKRLVTPVLVFAALLLAPLSAFAAPAGGGGGVNNGVFAFSMAFAIGLAALGGGLAQGRAVASALEGIARNPQSRGEVFTPMLLGLAFIESLVIFALLIAFVINGQMG